MTSIVKASTRADLLAIVPGLLGYTPTNSVVLVAFRGKRSCGALRFDLPRSESKTVTSRIASTMIGWICKLPAADAVVAVIYTDQTFARSIAAPHRQLGEVLRRKIDQSGFEVRGLLCHAADGWASYGHRFPAGGHDLAELRDSTAAAEVARHDRPLSGDQNSLGAIADVDPMALERFTLELDRLRGLVEAMTDGDQSVDPSIDSLMDVPLLAEDALCWSAEELDVKGALLLLAVQGPPNRDLVMLQWASSLEVGDALYSQALGEPLSGPFTEEDLGNLMFGIGARPNVDRIQLGIALLGELLVRASGRERLPLLTMLAWLSWALGMGSRADGYLQQSALIEVKSFCVVYRSRCDPSVGYALRAWSSGVTSSG